MLNWTAYQLALCEAPPEGTHERGVWVSILIDAGEAAGAHFMNFASLTFAYIIAMYVAGQRLSRFQIISVTVLYSVYLLMPARSVLGSANIAANAVAEARKIDAELAAAFFPSASELLPLIWNIMPYLFVAAWVLSILFMFSVRKSRNGA